MTVLGQDGEWLKIAPTPGCFSVIAKKLVDADATGKAGTVTGDNVWARAGGELCSWTNVQQFYQVHRELNKGNKVEILGSAGDYYKITPPKACVYWINSKLVDLAGKTPHETVESGHGTDVAVHVDNSGHETAETPAGPARTTQPAIDPNSPAGQFKTVEQGCSRNTRSPRTSRIWTPCSASTRRSTSATTRTSSARSTRP